MKYIKYINDNRDIDEIYKKILKMKLWYKMEMYITMPYDFKLKYFADK